jgi:phosphatidylglycerol:prolipoprotein diacylglycerol transferase
VHPILFELGPVTIYSYGVLLASAYLIGLFMAVRRANAAGVDGNKVLDLGIWVIIAALVGAKALLFVVEFEHFTSSREEFLSLLRSGGVFYGGLIGAVVVCIYQLRKHKLRVWPAGDLFAPGIAAGYMVGRLGCLMAGCCYGKPTQVAWAVTFTDPAAAMNVGTPLGVPLHPTQVYESLAGLIILVVLLATERLGRRFAGRTFWSFVLMYAVSRFVIEFFRGDDRGAVAMFSTSQFISLVLFPLSLFMLWYLGRLDGGTPATDPGALSGTRRRRTA